MTQLTLALCGNPNSGKTTLFNLLTGSDQKIGNWPGVTVEKKTGILKNHPEVVVADTPGIYSLSPFSPDEQITEGYLASGNADIVLNVVDCTDLERSLFLTSQLAEQDTPIVVALNMCDEARKKGIFVNKMVLEEAFGCKVFEISAAKNTGIDALVDFCLSEGARRKIVAAKKHVTHAQMHTSACEHIYPKCPHGAQYYTVDCEAAAAAAAKRYEKISDVVKRARKFSEPSKSEQSARNLTRKIDDIVLNKWLAFPIFVGVMTLVFCCSIGIGGLITDLINDKLTLQMQNAANAVFAGVPWLCSLVSDGVIAGVMSVIGFVPQIMLLFGFIAALEACGYMSRIAFVTDRLLNKIGLGGRSFVALVLGCGCSVPAIMSARTIKNENERNATVTLTPFMPCSAKLAIISYFTGSLFGSPLVAVSFYFVSILAVVLGGVVLKAFGRKYDDDTFLLELPQYRAPTASNVAKQMWQRGKAFLTKAGTTIFAASIVLWALNYLGILQAIGKFVAPLFVPLGFDDCGCGWQFAVAALSGIAAKETVFETLQILLPQGAAKCISPLGAYAFVVYNILTVPCAAAISTGFAEQGKKRALFSVAFQCAMAYVVSLALYQMGKFAQNNPNIFAAAICVATLAACLGFALKHLLAHKNCSCECCCCDACKNATKNPQGSKSGKG